MTSDPVIARARAAAQRFPILGRIDAVARLGHGLINDTFAIDASAGRFVLQRLNPIFDPRIHWNIEAVTRHLQSAGVATPLLVASDQDRPWLEDEGTWRVQTRLPGVTFDRIVSAGQPRAAGLALGRFHGALADLDHEFVALRTGVHDTDAHLAALRQALDEHREHRLHAQVGNLAEAILRGVEALPHCDGVPERIVHGDPKLNNVLFEGDEGDSVDRPIALVDLDTVAPMPLHLELGDAWRSWCNRAGEDEMTAGWDRGVFDESLRGWWSTRPFELEPAERQALVHGVEWITLELAARFAADALAERYFGWDRQRYASAGEHNLVRARGQWSLHQAVLAERDARARTLDEVLG